MKRSLVYAMIIAIGIAISCGGGKLGGNLLNEKGEVVKTEQWVNDDTFQLVGMGAPPDEETNPFVRKAMSKEAATIDAQVKVIEKFIGAKVQGAAGVKNFRATGVAAAKEVEGAIKGGSVFRAEFDQSQNCIVVYEVKAKGLKKSIQDIKMSK